MNLAVPMSFPLPEMQTPLSTPEISDEDLFRLAKQIQPVIRRKRGTADVLFFIKPCDLRRVAFAWDPKPASPVTDLVEHARIRTLHTFAYQGFFKPTIAEVLAQIPAEHLASTVAFEVAGPKDAEALNREKEALHASFHVAETTLYRWAAPELRLALAESLKLQSHYADLLNMHDAGHRIGFKDVEAWLARLRKTGTLPNP